MKKLCVVVPYRDRESHLEEFIPCITETLSNQKIDSTILIVEQAIGKPFNRAKLLNVGFDYTNGEYDYYCFHDIDMLPVESDYGYCSNPTHLASRAEQFEWKLPYTGYFGGVTIFDKESFLSINGYSNEYWGWGAEDDDVFNRCSAMDIKIYRKDCSFRSLHHTRNIVQDDYTKNLKKLQNFSNSLVEGSFIEGLNTLQYEIVSEIQLEKYKKITVEI